jgi:hypothetical protein
VVTNTLAVIAFPVGLLIVVSTVLSAIETLVVPRAIPLRITRAVFLTMRALFGLRGKRARSFSLHPPMSPLELIVLPGSRPVLATRSVHLLDAAPCDCQSASKLRG